MLSKQITIADISQLTGYSRHKLRGLLNELAEFNCRSQKERIASEYSAKDLVLLTICCELESMYGLRRKVVGALIEPLYTEMTGPRPVSEAPHLIIDVQRRRIQYVENPTVVTEGIVFPLSGIFKKVDTYLTFESGINQNNLDFGPWVVSTAKKEETESIDAGNINTSNHKRSINLK